MKDNLGQYGVIGLFIISFSTGFLGCSSKPSIKVEPLSDAADPTAELMQLDENLERARKSQVNVFAPDSYDHANKAFREAKEQMDEGKSSKDVLQKIAEGKSYLKHADEIAQISESALGNVVEARKRAIDAQAPELVKNEFADADHNLNKVVSDIEGGNTASARSEQDKLEKEYRKVELNAKLQGNLGPSAGMLKTAKDEDAEKWAPKSLSVAEKQFREAKAFILKHPENTEEIKRLSSAAQASAEQTLTFTREAKKVKKQSPEDTVAQLEAEKRNLQAYQEKSSRSEAALEEQQSKIHQIESQQAFDQKFAKARAQFSVSEAEILRRGDTLVIRLVGLSFPPAKANIPSENYSLLNKVATVIQEFGKSNVRVEGHTDSTGSRAKNLKISAKRAESVKNYLAANPAAQSGTYQAVGMGDENPVSSNKTVAGRERNRRVDILILPVS